MIRRDDVYKIGKLGKPHGVKGEITFAITDDVFDRVDAEYLVLDINGILVPFYLFYCIFRNDITQSDIISSHTYPNTSTQYFASSVSSITFLLTALYP